MAKTKKITLDDLAMLIETNNKNNGQVLKKVDSLSGKVDSLAGQVDSLSGKVDSLTKRVDSLDEKVQKNSDDIDSLAIIVNNRFDESDKKIEKIQTDVEFLKQGEDRIELRLTNVAYRLDVVNLQDRVRYHTNLISPI